MAHQTGIIVIYCKISGKRRVLFLPNCSGVSPFMVPCVPTGMKTGVSTREWGSLISPTLGQEQ